MDSIDPDCDDAGEALFSALIGDCDDASAGYNPAAIESDCADPNDYNCDGSTGFSNEDGDAFAACEECDDSDASAFPGATEGAGDGVDGDCDGVDTCYVDADGDAYRTGATVTGTTVACDGPGEATVDAGDDCKDADAGVNPAAIETVGDAVDADCDGAERCFMDADGDGYRSDDGATVGSDDADCTDAGEALASAGLDCDDASAAVNPSATETAGDEVDSDCDNTEVCFMDADADGYRPDSTSTVARPDVTCTDAGEALASAPTTDCDDGDAGVNPASIELAGDAVDSDCDGTELCYLDADDDGYLDGSDVTVDADDADCEDLTEALVSTLSGDCDDASADYNPGATEADCADADDDGSRPDATATVSSTNLACDGLGEAVATDPADDCDDADAAIYAGAVEVVGDEVDSDCDGAELCYVDADADGYVSVGGGTVASADLLCDGTGEALADAASGDCDDASAAYNPGAVEDDCLDPADYNCDGSSGFADSDGEGYAACAECDDAPGAINPDAEEVCDGADNDCDGGIDVDALDAVIWYADADADGYTDPAAAITACEPPVGYAAATEDDCDDADATSFPGAEESLDDGIDQDCDGEDATDDSAGDDTGDATGDGKDDAEGCGCASPDGAGFAGWFVVGALALAARRRRVAS